MPSATLQQSWRCRFVAFWMLLLASTVGAEEPGAEQIAFFENEIRPLLSKHCYECHSEAGDNKGRLHLDKRSSILRGGDSGPAATPGKPKNSPLIDAIEYRGGLEMPPNGKLPAEDVTRLIRWVEMGLPWPKEAADDAPPQPASGFQITAEQRAHWSFQPIRDQAPPDVSAPEWSGTAIDRFIYSALQARQLVPNGLADRATLLRRVTYDLTGLPPTPEELHEFLNDESAEAWSSVIDRLLASPHYGERWGRHWLDVVRYSDTAGDASDYPIPDAYKYRNYVIRSFNEDKPYDQFLCEQYAGDLMAAEGPPEKFAERTIATSLLALSRRFGYNDTTFYFFHLTMADLIDNMGMSVLGLSIGCARCHDHKFEPISAQDYYALYGIFSSTKFTYPGGEEVRFPKDLIPLVPRAEAAHRLAEREQQLSVVDAAIRTMQIEMAESDGGFEQQIVGKTPATPWKADAAVVVSESAQSPYQNVFAAGHVGLRIPNTDANRGFSRPLAERSSSDGDALCVNVDFRNVSVDAGGDGHYRICLCHQKNFSAAVEILVNGQGVSLNNGGVQEEISKVPLGAWCNLQLQVNLSGKSYSGTLTDGTSVWSFTEKAFHPQWDGTVDLLLIDSPGKEAGVRPARDIDNVSVRREPFPIASENAAAERNTAESWGRAKDEVARRTTERGVLAQSPIYPTANAVAEGTPSDAPFQHRGEPNRLGDKVPRRFLEILGGEKLPDDCRESGRRELAAWLVSPKNPLTARVITNRVWHYHFGRGIVSTPNDFGIRGEPPSHPELLDLLATQLVRQGWSLKSLHREILLSRAYQLSGAAHDLNDMADPANQWLWRFSRARLDAESLRDSMLLISGELDRTPGAAHPFPAVSTWKFSQHNPFKAVYETRKRSVYLMTQRIARHPYLALFDGADTNTTTGQRLNTTTPLQALYLMNDPFVHDRAKATAQRLIAASPEASQRVQILYESAWSREATPEEQKEAANFLKSYATQVPDIADRDVAALAAYVRAVFASNQFLYVD